MKLFLPLPAAALALSLAACSNTTVVAHKTAFDINAEFSADLAKPVSANIGYESHAAVAVPPRNSQHWKTLFNQAALPSGDALSAVTAMKIQRVVVNNPAGGPSDFAFDYVAAAATGKAADAATGIPVPPAAAEDAVVRAASATKAADSKTFEKAASDIATKTDSIPVTPEVVTD